MNHTMPHLISILTQKRWIIASIVVILAASLMVRAGFWQWGRLQERRAQNALIIERRIQPPLLLDSTQAQDPPPLEHRPVLVRGTWDYTHEIILRNRAHDGRPGVHILTPLQLPDGHAVLVDRGWIPQQDADPETRADFHEQSSAETVTLIGIARLTQPTRGWLSPPELPIDSTLGRRDAWLRVDLATIQAQIPYPLLPLWVEATPDPQRTQSLPWRPDPAPPSEGSHLSYALQWWSFAIILLLCYTALLIQVTREQQKRNPSYANTH